jgi:hypothetical protein
LRTALNVPRLAAQVLDIVMQTPEISRYCFKPPKLSAQVLDVIVTLLAKST